MVHLATQELYFARFYSLDEILERIDKVSQEDIISLAERIFKEDNVSIVSIGDKRDA
jgi:predicted Zn-dependent peptidase